MRLFLFLSMFISGCSSVTSFEPVRGFQHNLDGEKYYVVKSGDTLYSIGARSGKGYKRLSWWNKILPPYQLKVGQKLRLFKIKQKLIKGRVNKNLVSKGRYSSQRTLTNSYNKKKMLKLYWQWPVKGKVIKNFYQTSKKGIDIAGRVGQKVMASAAGKVVYAGSGLKGYGNLLIIKHNDLYLSAYANNSRLLVKEDQKVKKGQVIAEIGRVKNTQASLHFEIRKNGDPVNPTRYLPRR